MVIVISLLFELLWVIVLSPMPMPDAGVLLHASGPIVFVNVLHHGSDDSFYFSVNVTHEAKNSAEWRIVLKGRNLPSYWSTLLKRPIQ